MDDGVQSLPACLASAGTRPISYCLPAAAGKEHGSHKGKTVGAPTSEVELGIGRRDNSCKQARLCLVGLEVGRPVGRHGEATAFRCVENTGPIAGQLVQVQSSMISRLKQRLLVGKSDQGKESQRIS